MAAVPGGNSGRPRRAGRSMLGGLGGQGSRPAGVTTKVRFAPGVYAGGGTRGAHIPGTVPDRVAAAIPANLAAEAGDEEILITWDAVTNDDLHITQPYYYRYGTANPPTGDGTAINDTEVTVEGLINDTPYFFQVRSKDDSGNLSAWSSVVSETPVAP